jgi:hypothetical protein
VDAAHLVLVLEIQMDYFQDAPQDVVALEQKECVVSHLQREE